MVMITWWALICKALRYGTCEQGMMRFYLQLPRLSTSGTSHTCLCCSRYESAEKGPKCRPMCHCVEDHVTLRRFATTKLFSRSAILRTVVMDRNRKCHVSDNVPTPTDSAAAVEAYRISVFGSYTLAHYRLQWLLSQSKENADFYDHRRCVSQHSLEKTLENWVELYSR